MKPPLLPRGVTAVLLSAGLAPSLHAASNLEITVHAKAAPIGEFTGTVASGSGAAYGVGDGTFAFVSAFPDFQFRRPVAANDHVAFYGLAEFDPPPQVQGEGIGRGLFGGSDGLHTVAISLGPASGTPGGFNGVFGEMALDATGNLAFSASWAKITPPTSSGTGIWFADVDLGFPDALTPVALSGQSAPGTGAVFGNLNAGPIFQNGTYIAFISGGLGNWTYNKATQQLQRVSYVNMPVPIFGEGLTLIGGAGLVGAGEVLGLTGGGQLLIRATTNDNRTRLFLASATDAITPLLSVGDNAPGLPGKTIRGLGAGVNSASDVAILAVLDDGDGNFGNDTSALYLRRASGTIELVTHGGAPLAGMPAGLWGGSPLINEPRRIFLPALGVIDPAGAPGATPVFTAVPAIPTTPGVSTSTGWSFNDLGQIVAYIQETNGTAHALWLHQPGEGWTEIARRGTTMMIEPAPAAPTMVNSIGFVHDSGGRDGKATGLTNDGQVVFIINGQYILSARAVAPDITVESGTQTFDEFIPVINKLTITGGTAIFDEGVGTVRMLDQTGGTLNIEKDDTTVEDASISGGTISGDASMTIEESANITGEALIWLRELILKKGVSLRGALQLADATRVLFEGGSGLDAILALDGDVRIWGEGEFINRGTIVNGEEGEDPEQITFNLDSRFEQSEDGTFLNYGTVIATKRFDVGGSFGNFGNLTVSWEGSGTAPESSFDFLENFGKLSISDGASVRLKRVSWDLSSSLEISDAVVTYEDGDDAVFVPSLSMEEEAELQFPATYRSTRAFDVGDMTVSGPGNTISAPADATHRVQVDVQGEVTYSSSTSFRLENIVYRSQATSTVTNEGPLQLELLNSAYTLLAPWTPGADVNVKLEDKPSYFGTAATFKIPQGRIFTITGGDMPGKVYGLPGADIHLDGVLNGDLGLYGAFNSSRIPDWTGYYPDRPLPTYLNLAQSPGDGTINGDLTLGRLATLVCELAGTQQGVTYDHLDVNGTLTINGGLLDLRFLDGFETTTQPTDVFVLVEADAPIAGAFANVASGQRLNTSDGLRSFEVHYGAGSAHGENRVVATNAGPFVDTAVPPAIGTQPSTRNATAGSNPTFTVAATGAGPFTYQWYFNGIAISSATNATLTIPFAQAFQAGTYSVIVSNAHGAVVSSPAVLNISTPPPNNARLLNLSTRALAQTGDNVLIPGFVISGTGTKKLLIRAVGPRLAQMGVPADDVLPDPRMILKRWNGNSYDDLLANDNWIDNANAVDIALTAEDVFAFPLESDLEAALLVDLAPGQYTVVADGVNQATGTALVEFYDADAPNPSARLINISNRGFCGLGDQVMIPGFWVSHEGPKTFLIRVVGPRLATPPFNVTGTMADPKLEIFPTGAKTPILSNDDWGDNSDAATTAQVAKDVFAFSLPEGSADAAFVVTLPPGGYTVVGSSSDGVSTGIVLVEVYVVQ